MGKNSDYYNRSRKAESGNKNKKQKQTLLTFVANKMATHYKDYEIVFNF